MSKRSELLKQRYAEDPEYREGVLAGNRARYAVRKDEINAGKRLRYATDPEYRQTFLERDKDKVREKELRRKYGMSLQDYDAMLARQNGACAICRRTFEKTPSVDHCHATNIVRGLLCSKCNQGLGCYDDDIDLMRAAVAYLQSPPSSIGCVAARPRRDRAAPATTGAKKSEAIKVDPPQLLEPDLGELMRVGKSLPPPLAVIPAKRARLGHFRGQQ
jgi:hypothetical protein